VSCVIGRCVSVHVELDDEGACNADVIYLITADATRPEPAFGAPFHLVDDILFAPTWLTTVR